MFDALGLRERIILMNPFMSQNLCRDGLYEDKYYVRAKGWVREQASV